jgi:hypothetical protein
MTQTLPCELPPLQSKQPLTRPHTPCGFTSHSFGRGKDSQPRSAATCHSHRRPRGASCKASVKANAGRRRGPTFEACPPDNPDSERTHRKRARCSGGEKRHSSHAPRTQAWCECTRESRSGGGGFESTKENHSGCKCASKYGYASWWRRGSERGVTYLCQTHAKPRGCDAPAHTLTSAAPPSPSPQPLTTPSAVPEQPKRIAPVSIIPLEHANGAE